MIPTIQRVIDNMPIENTPQKAVLYEVKQPSRKTAKVATILPAPMGSATKRLTPLFQSFACEREMWTASQIERTEITEFSTSIAINGPPKREG
jgi:hypothetical protein